MTDIIDFNKVKQDKSIKEIENHLLDKLVFEHAEPLFPGFKENFKNDYKNADTATKLAMAISGFKDRISSHSPELAELYYIETLQVLVTFYTTLKKELGGKDEDFTNNIIDNIATPSQIDPSSSEEHGDDN